MLVSAHKWLSKAKPALNNLITVRQLRDRLKYDE